MHLSVLQGKTSLLQIIIHLFLLLFHRVYFFLLTISAQSVFQDIVCNSILTLLVCFVCIGPFKYTGPIAIALSLFASYIQQSQWSAHNQIPPRVLTMEDAYEMRILNTFTHT